MVSRADDEKIIDLPSLSQTQGLTAGSGMIFVIPEPDLVEAGFMQKGVSIDPLAAQQILHFDGIVLTGEGADLDGETDLLQSVGTAARFTISKGFFQNLIDVSGRG